MTAAPSVSKVCVLPTTPQCLPPAPQTACLPVFTESSGLSLPLQGAMLNRVRQFPYPKLAFAQTIQGQKSHFE